MVCWNVWLMSQKVIWYKSRKMNMVPEQYIIQIGESTCIYLLSLSTFELSKNIKHKSEWQMVGAVLDFYVEIWATLDLYFLWFYH